MSQRTAVYVARDDNDEVIYVGLTNNPDRRWVEHEEKDWHKAVARWEIIDWYPTRRMARIIELALIDEYDPPANIADADTPWLDWNRISEPRRWGKGLLVVLTFGGFVAALIEVVIRGKVLK